LASLLYFLGTFFLAEGLLFKTMHWPGGNVTLDHFIGFGFADIFDCKSYTAAEQRRNGLVEWLIVYSAQLV